MATPIRFLLNDQDQTADMAPGTTVLDFVRTHQRLMGTKIGCREGDCGACMVLVGDFAAGQLDYRTMTSCLLPLVNVHGKHVVTIEGLNLPGRFNVAQDAMAEHGATQCGFCSTGFVVSLAGYCLDRRPPSPARAVAAIDGNICRCTGYKSIERAAAQVHDRVAACGSRSCEELVVGGFVPDYFRGIAPRLARLQTELAAADHQPLPGAAAIPVGGGTDLYVQRPEHMVRAALRPVFGTPEWRGVTEADGRFVVGGETTFTEFAESPELCAAFPELPAYVRLFASSPIRNMATVAGNLVNASPIGDLTILLLGLGADVELAGPAGTRTLPLHALYRGYKTLDRSPDEIVTRVSFAAPGPGTGFHFQKVSKRTHLDIASVNSAARLEMHDGSIERAFLSAGGVAPVPLFLARTSAALAGRPLDAATVRDALDMAQTEVAPISDARGTADYKRLLLRQLLAQHFVLLGSGCLRWEDVL